MLAKRPDVTAPILTPVGGFGEVKRRPGGGDPASPQRPHNGHRAVLGGFPHFTGSAPSAQRVAHPNGVVHTLLAGAAIIVAMTDGMRKAADAGRERASAAREAMGERLDEAREATGERV